jgi:hypothetical protein
MPTRTHTGVRDLLRNDVSGALFHLVREHLEERGSRPGRYGKLVIKQASEAAYIGVRRLNGGATKTELARHLGCSEGTIDRRRRVLSEALREGEDR